ncbi:MAG: long-chain fatty acid--CoA ligase [Hydrogenophilaceae bacterium]|jgi:acyl-CoA synthetase (AMP-forming)/AMP-acid ligase II|nr:long-chain fatty acid--CoA ligase [Hydrogenophilaceae bacterium]
MPKLKNLVDGVVAIAPDADAVEFRGAWRPWRALRRGMDAVDAALSAAGAGEGARVGVLLRNHADLIGAILSIVTSERCIVTLNALAPGDKLAAELEALRLPAVIGLDADWRTGALADAAKATGTLALAVDEGGEAIAPVAGLNAIGSDPARRTAPGIGIEMLTSGTTGAPKRVPLKTRNFERMVLETAIYEKGRRGDDQPKLRGGVQILTAPFAHIGGLLTLFTCICAGRKGALLERFSVEAFVDAVSRHRPKTAGAPPSALRMLLDADVPKEKLSSLVVFRTGTAPLDPDLADAFLARYGIPVLQNYGATEFAGGVAGWTLEDFKDHHKAKRGSVGRVHAGVEARIVDPETGAPLAPGETGLLELKAAHLGDGQWVRTTDLAALDEDRFLWIKGRHDNAIIRGGFKILPDDVVRAIELHPAIREASVVALPDPRLGQVPAAAYIIKANADAPSEEALRAFLRERLLPYQLPVRLLAVAEFPRTPSMKVSQPDLQALFAATP